MIIVADNNRTIVNSILVFLYIFMFRIIGMFDSSVLVGILVGMVCILGQQKRRIFIKIIRTKSFVSLSLSFLFFIAWILFCSMINVEYDYSFIKTLIHMYIQIIFGLLLYSYLCAEDNEKNILKYITNAFLIQSIIIIFGIIYQPFRDFLLLTKNEHEIQLANHYDYRGASLSGSSYFGLAISFALFFIIFSLKENESFRKKILIRIICFVVLFVAALSAGRTSVIGLLLAIFMVMIREHKIRKKNIAKYFFTVVGIVIIGYGVVLVSNNILTYDTIKTLKYFGEYITEFFSSKGGGRFHTTSTEFLFSSMFFEIDLKTLFIGDSLYTSVNGYYMNTDSGYMRPILYAGLPALFFLLLIHVFICNMGSMRKNNKVLFYVLMILTLVLQIKGEVLGFALIYNNVLLLLSMYYKEMKVDELVK